MHWQHLCTQRNWTGTYRSKHNCCKYSCFALAYVAVLADRHTLQPMSGVDADQRAKEVGQHAFACNRGERGVLLHFVSATLSG